MIRSALIVGAGIAGLACAGELARAGVRVTVLDKGRRPGGRVSSRVMDPTVFNHGAQFVTARGAGFGAVIADLLAEGVAGPWPAAGEGRIVFRPGMSALPAALVSRAREAGAVVQSERHAGWLHADAGGWRMRHFPADEIPPGGTRDAGGVLSDPQDAVLLALPPAQASALLAVARHPFAEAAARPVMAPCWAVMARFPVAVPGADVLADNGGSPVAWAAREGSRPGAEPGPDAWTIHAGPAWSAAHLEGDQADGAAALVAAFRALSGAAAPDRVVPHRWRYALVETPLGEPCLWDAGRRIGACGDWCIGGRVEAAFDSGVALARAALG